MPVQSWVLLIQRQHCNPKDNKLTNGILVTSSQTTIATTKSIISCANSVACSKSVPLVIAPKTNPELAKSVANLVVTNGASGIMVASGVNSPSKKLSGQTKEISDSSVSASVLSKSSPAMVANTVTRIQQNFTVNNSSAIPNNPIDATNNQSSKIGSIPGKGRLAEPIVDSTTAATSSSLKVSLPEASSSTMCSATSTGKSLTNLKISNPDENSTDQLRTNQSNSSTGIQTNSNVRSLPHPSLSLNCSLAVESKMLTKDDPASVSPSTRHTISSTNGSSSAAKIDTSVTSVNSALSVLKRSTLSEKMPPASPKCSYRYGSRGALSSIYRNRLSSSTSDVYKQNMNQLYGDFYSLTKNTTTPVLNSNALGHSPQPGSPIMPILHRSVSDSIDRRPPELVQRSTSLVSDRRNRCNAPQPVRRALSNSCTLGGQEKDNPIDFRWASHGDDSFSKLSAEKKSALSTVLYSPIQNTRHSFDLCEDTDANFIDDILLEDPSSSEILNFPVRKKNKKPERHVSFDSRILLLNAAFEGELEVVKDTTGKVMFTLRFLK